MHFTQMIIAYGVNQSSTSLFDETNLFLRKEELNSLASEVNQIKNSLRKEDTGWKLTKLEELATESNNKGMPINFDEL